MARVEYADGIVVWRRSLMAKAIWGLVLGAFAVAIVIVEGLDLDQRVLFLGLVTLATAAAWVRVWRPHLAATADGLVVRRARGAILVPWADVVGAELDGRWGITILVRSGDDLRSAVPACGLVKYVLDLDSEADRATRYIEERVRLQAMTGDDAEIGRTN